MRIQLFEEHNAKKNAFLLFLITLLFCFIGGHLRFPQELSLFWPVNAIVTGVIVRNPFLHQTRSYLAIFAAMVFNDTVFSGWALSAFTLNLANLLFVLVAATLLVKHLQHDLSVLRVCCVFFRPVCWPRWPVPAGERWHSRLILMPDWRWHGVTGSASSSQPG